MTLSQSEFKETASADRGAPVSRDAEMGRPKGGSSNNLAVKFFQGWPLDSGPGLQIGKYAVDACMVQIRFSF